MTEIYKTYKQMIERSTEPGFHKVDGNNCPKISYLMILDFMAKSTDRQSKNNVKKEYLDEDIDFVQMKTAAVFTKLTCLIAEKGQAYTAERVLVGVVIDSKKKEFTSVVCNRCEGKWKKWIIPRKQIIRFSLLRSSV